MRYFVRRKIIAPHKILPIEREEFESLIEARNALDAARAIEEKYDLMISNYVEFEDELLRIMTSFMVFQKDSYDDFLEMRIVLNRRIVNLLTSTKLYYDHMLPQIRLCDLKNQELESLVKMYFQNEYDSRFEYRFMENLRNHVQHCGLAIHSWSFRSSWAKNLEPDQMVRTLKIFSNKSDLSNDHKFRRKPVYAECDEKIDLVMAIRVYVESLSKIHTRVRVSVSNSINKYRTRVETTISAYEKINDGESLGIFAYSVTTDDPEAECEYEVPLLLDWDNVRINLEAKNTELVNLSRTYVSSNCY